MGATHATQRVRLLLLFWQREPPHHCPSAAAQSIHRAHFAAKVRDGYTPSNLAGIAAALLLAHYYNHCDPLRTIANHCELLRTIANHCELLRTIANYCELLRTIAFAIVPRKAKNCEVLTTERELLQLLRMQ